MHFPRKSHHVHNAFTLIELLVVISIIALLISILLPALSQAREAGRSIKCLNNQRQIGLAMAIYQNTYDDAFPESTTRTGPTMPWSATLYREGLSPAVFQCPSFNYTYPDFTNIASADVNVAADRALFYSVHYGYNHSHIGTKMAYTSVGDADRYAPAKIVEIAKPGQTIVTLDHIHYSDWTSGTRVRGYYSATDHAFSTLRAHARHSNGSVINILWADGHGSATNVASEFNPYPEITRYVAGQDNYWDRD